jgi:hypothetical protein
MMIAIVIVRSTPSDGEHTGATPERVVRRPGYKG